MVVDDSALYRKVISDVIAEETNLQVVGTAPNGRIALMKIPDQSPDLIVLDMEMPEMDGLTTLRELARQHPNIRK
jgi:two-component system chemotaxis response regulator CheB